MQEGGRAGSRHIPACLSSRKMRATSGCSSPPTGVLVSDLCYKRIGLEEESDLEDQEDADEVEDEERRIRRHSVSSE
jgi:hypothetical protein